MKTGTLNKLLSAKLNPERFQIRGTAIYWLATPTAEETALAADVIADYDTLAVAHQAQKMKQQAIDAIQSILDAQAKAYGFDSVHTALAWRNSKDPTIKATALALEDWADDVWIFARKELKLQEEGTPTYNKIEDFLAALPAFPEA
jgi:hypothetical protein